MVKIKDTLYCDACGIEIECQPYIEARRVYCCRDCANGLGCSCGEYMEEEDRRASYPVMPG